MSIRIGVGHCCHERLDRRKTVWEGIAILRAINQTAAFGEFRWPGSLRIHRQGIFPYSRRARMPTQIRSREV